MGERTALVQDADTPAAAGEQQQGHSLFEAAAAIRVGVQHRPAPALCATSTTLEHEQQELARTKVWISEHRQVAAQHAAVRFDGRQRSLRNNALKAVKDTAASPADPRASDAFQVQIKDLFRHRYFVAEKAPVTMAMQRRQKSHGGWRIEDSIWAGRQFRDGEDRGFIDDDSIIARAIQYDFNKALTSNLPDFLLKHDSSAPGPNASPDDVQAFFGRIEKACVDNGRTFFMVFDYFAAQSNSDDIFHVARLGYDQMIQQCDLPVKGSTHCDLAHLDIIFVAVNSSSEKALKVANGTGQTDQRRLKTMQQHDSRLVLTRSELLQCLVRIAVARYILTPKTKATPKAGKTSVAEAVKELFRTLREKADREVLQNGIHFRLQHCYTEEADLALRAHEPQLRVLFSKYASGEGVKTDPEFYKPGLQRKQGTMLTSARMTTTNSSDDRLLSPGEWVALCRELKLLGDDFSVEEARLVFMWSRMRVIDEDNPKHRERIENLRFWDFLEAIIRVAQSKAIPTDDEWEQAGYSDGGQFLLQMERDDPTDFQKFVTANNRKWWEDTRQPLVNNLVTTLLLMMHCLKDNIERWHRDGSIATAVKQGQKHRQQSRASPKKVSLPSPPAVAKGFSVMPTFDLTPHEDGSLPASTVAQFDLALDMQRTVLKSAATVMQKYLRGFADLYIFKQHRFAAIAIQKRFQDNSKSVKRAAAA